MKTLDQRRLQKPVVGHAYAFLFQYVHPVFAGTLLLLCCLNCSVASAQTLTLSPLRPVPGELVWVSYDPAGGTLAGESSITCQAKLFEGLSPETYAVPLQKEGDVFRGSLKTPANAVYVAFRFAGGGKSDQRSAGYQYPFYLQGQPVPGAGYAGASLLTEPLDMGFYGQKLPDHAAALELLKKERSSDFTGKYQVPVIREYFKALIKVDPIAGEKELAAYVELLSKEQPAEENYILRYWLYKAWNHQEDAQRMLVELSAHFPNSPMFFTKRFSEIENAKSGLEMEALVERFIADYQYSSASRKTLAEVLPVFYRKLAKAYGYEQNLDKFYGYLGRDGSPLYRSYSADAVALSLSSKGALLAEAEKISRLSLELLDSALHVVPLEDAVATLKLRAAQCSHTYGYLLYQNGKFAQALAAMQQALDGGAGKDAKLKVDYAQVLIAGGKPAQAVPLLEDALKEGNTEPRVSLAYREAFLAAGGKPSDYEKRLKELFELAQGNDRYKLRTKMLNEPAPDLLLLDMNGKKVSLADFRGKTVVLDLWATWCLPCKQSFPGMQQVVDKYAGKDVVFLFVNTLEKNTNNLKGEIGSYMKANRFNFTVVFDQVKKDDAMVYGLFSSLGLTSIPAKFVIDKTGRIRFRSTGYAGSDEAVVKEMSGQIDAVMSGR